MKGWTLGDMPDQSGRTGLVTGATDGLGLETALALTGGGMRVILAGRNRVKGEAALERIRTAHPGAEASFETVELADLASVCELAERIAGRSEPLDLLVNNAGVMSIPSRTETAQGFEMQFGVNYLSHFALTRMLLETLRRSRGPRVVSVASLAHRRAHIDFDDLQARRRYSPFGAYGQTKLAVLMFAKELQRRSDASGWGVVSVAAHPGVSKTHIFSNGPRVGAAGPPLMERLVEAVGPLVLQSAAAGALPILYAATVTDVEPGGYYGPSGLGEIRGAEPAQAKVSAEAADPAAAARLWTISETLLGLGGSQAAPSAA